jgi:hypothetical protein
MKCPSILEVNDLRPNSLSFQHLNRMGPDQEPERDRHNWRLSHILKSGNRPLLTEEAFARF